MVELLERTFRKDTKIIQSIQNRKNMDDKTNRELISIEE